MRTRALIDEVVGEAALRRNGVVGVTAVLRQDPHSMPVESKRGPAPACHTTNLSLREAFRAAYRGFVGAYRAAADALKVDRHSVVPFPEGSFPARASFVLPAASFVPPWLLICRDTGGLDAGAIVLT